MIKVIVNDTAEFRLSKWNAQDFVSDTTLYIINTNLTNIKDAFHVINKLVIMQESTFSATGFTPIAEYTVFDTCSSITYMGSVYSDLEQGFFETFSLTLSKANLAEQVQRIEDKINEYVDPETLSLEELRAYKLKEISAACTEDICAGETIELSDGTREHFSYAITDQLNYDELFILCLVAPEITELPYHSSNYGNCKFYPRKDIIAIVSTLMMRKTHLITYCNQLNIYINSLTNRDELLNATYGMELPEVYQEKINEIMAGTIEEVTKFLQRILPTE